jgi:parallel beta-helix repeat protein
MTIENSDLRSQSNFAIFASGSGLTLNTLNNYIAGLSNARVASSGIEYSSAVGTIQGNTVVDEIYPQAQFSTPVLLDSMGIFVYCSNASVTGNMVSNTQVGVVVGCQNGSSAATNATISGNKIFNTRLQDGIYIFSDGNKITSNTIVGSAASGIHFDTTYGFHDASGNTASGNTITEACAGILTTGTVTNTVSTNSFIAVDAPMQNGGTCGPLFQ